MKRIKRNVLYVLKGSVTLNIVATTVSSDKTRH